MKEKSIKQLVEASRNPDPKVRKAAVRDLCPCAIKVNDPRAWDRVIEMAADPDRDVRRIVLHTLIDGSPRSRQGDVARAVESMRNDLAPKLRRHARKVLARHRATGTVNLNLH